jgi:hypothetical protein
MLVAGASALALLAGPPARAASDADLETIRTQIQALKQDYDARIRALEERLKAAEADAAQAKSQAAAIAAAPGAPAASAAPPTPASATRGLAAFNPAISAILNGQYANLSRDPREWRMAGFLQGGEVGPGRRGFSLGESELGFSANVDPKFSGNVIVSLTPEDTVSVEEAYGIFKGAPAGIVPKFGRFFSGLGYLNEQHAHVWDFTDAPLAYQAFLGGQYQQNGVQATWVAPTDRFLELGAEVGNGDSFPGTPRDKNGAGDAVLFARTGGDVGDSHSWQAGVSYLRTGSRSREDDVSDLLGADAALRFTGHSRLWNASFVWKWAPHGDPHYRNFKLQGEYLWRREEGDLDLASAGAASGSPYSSRQSGAYLQAIYQFMPLWRFGLRYDWLDPGDVEGAGAAVFLASSFHPRRATAMVDWTPSEFSRVRLQFGRAQLSPLFSDNELFVQYILSLGAHGAHIF